MAHIAARQRHDLTERIAASNLASVPVREALPQLLAVMAAAVVIAATPVRDAEIGVSMAIAAGLAALRLIAARSRLARSTFILDAAAVALLIGGTGNADSAFLGMAIAGAWWASGLGRQGALYGAAFFAAYLLLVVPGALRENEVAAVIFQPMMVGAVGVLGDRLRATSQPSRWAFTVLHRQADGGHESVRVGLSRAIRGGSVPIDVLLTAGQLGLTVAQTELIPYLILGLSNQEIADALTVSEATVRYRLTGLYRILDVKGRKAAAERARELGLDALVGNETSAAPPAPHQSAPK